jgi:Protein of unknown function (DUF2852)
MNEGASAATADAALGQNEQAWRSSCKSGKKRRWSGTEIAVVVGSFIVFWPLGVAAMAVKLYKGELWNGASDTAPPWQNWKRSRDEARETWKNYRGHQGSSGNAAFDDYRKTQLDRLEQERRKLDDERQAFADHLAKLRRAKDQEEFDRFMAERNAPQV